VTEAHVQQTVTEFLELDGWRSIRTDPVSDRARGKGFGELGMPDYLYIRYAVYRETGLPASLDDPPTARLWNQLLWIEYKRPGAKPTAHQIAWHKAERARGALVLVVDDIDAFRKWYAESGLKRR